MWEQIARPWQAAIEQAWLAFSAGSLPIGAVIASPDGQVITRGRNRLFDAALDRDAQHFKQHFMAHAEQNAFVSFGNLLREQPAINEVLQDYTLFTTLEPCPMCAGTFIQSGIRNIQYLIPDPMGGAIESIRSTADMRAQALRIEGPFPGTAGSIVYTLLVVIIMRAGMLPMPDQLPPSIQPFSDGFALGKALATSGALEEFIQRQVPVSDVFESLAEQLRVSGG